MALHNDFKVKNGLLVATTATFLSTVNAVSTNSGAVQVVGGVGVNRDLWVGGNITVIGTINASVQGITTTATNIAGGTANQIPYQTNVGQTGFAGPGTAGQVLLSGGVNGPYFSSTLTLASTIQSLSTNTGALQVQGGVGIGLNLNVGGSSQFGGITTVSNTTGVVGLTSGALQVLGGVGINGGLFVGNTITGTSVTITGTTASTSTTTGALTVAGGVGVLGSIYAGNIYSNGVLVGGSASTATTATNLAGGFIGAVPYQLSTGTTTFAQGFAYNGSYLTVNTNTVLTTASIIGQVGISVASTGTSSVYLAFIPGAQGLTADFGLIGDPVGQNYFDFGSF
jgi:hypothetical protein